MNAEDSQLGRASDARDESADAESLASAAEHVPSSAVVVSASVNPPPEGGAPEGQLPVDVVAPANDSSVPSSGSHPAVEPGGLDLDEDHRQTVANILQSLTGTTLGGEIDADAANERRCRELIGQRVNNFEIVGLLSSGGMGDVFEAIHLVIHRKVAIKVLRQEHVADPALVQRFFNEARAANSIRHPNIVEILDVGMLPGGLPYIAMERLEGETLAQRLSREGKLDIECAVDFAVQAASALQAAHKRGIVHRDLKPDNLYIVADPRVAGRELVKVLDFGIAKLHGDKLSQVKTNVGSILGTPPYMSPEQCRGIPDAVDHRSDVYALGVILFEMLCGAPPFVAEGVGDVMVMHLSSPPPLPRWRRQEIPLRIEQTILWAMEKNPDQRIPGMSEFIFTLCSGPTPVPYIVTPTGLTTAELPPSSLVPSNLAPRYQAPAISLEGDFSLDDVPLGEEESDERDARVVRRASTPPRGYRIERRNSAPPAPESREASRRNSGAPPPSARGSWRAVASRGVAVGALGAAAAAAAVMGFDRMVSSEQPRASRVSELPTGSVSPDVAAASDRGLDVTTGALRGAPSIPSGLVEIVRSPEGALSETTAERASGDALAASQVITPGAGPARRGTAPRWMPRSTARLGSPVGVTGAPGDIPDPASVEVASEHVELAEPRAPDVSVEATPTPEASVGPSNPQPSPPSAPAEATTGALNFDSSPWARVSLDGRVLGVTPLRGVHLPAGTHRLRLENSELGTSTTVVVEIKPGQSVSRFVGWEQRP